MAKQKHVPARATSRENSKQVKIQEATNATGGKPAWRFSTVDRNGPFAWPIGDNAELEIVEKLHQFDSMKWGEIEGNDHHAIPLSKLSPEAQKRLAEIKQDDIDEIFSFHSGGKPRIIGIRDRDLVKLLWWDKDHLVCPSHKKHT